MASECPTGLAQMVDLVRTGLATAHSQRMVVGRRVIEIAHVKITDAGRRALTDKCNDQKAPRL
jgi:hypothetical protein